MSKIASFVAAASLLLNCALFANESGYERESKPGKIEICGVTAKDPIQLIEKILSLPKTTLIEQTDEFLTIEDDKGTFWTLALSKHPASPAIICRQIGTTPGGEASISMQVACFAEKAPCDKLTADFAAHNNKVTEQTPQ